MDVIQGKVVGVIIPPPDIRAVVDKTAQFVARNGKSFEERIMKSEEGMTSKFSFLKAFDPYHSYYELKIREAEGSIHEKIVVKEEAPQVHAEEISSPAKTEVVVVESKASLITPLARLVNQSPESEPLPFEFTLTQPVNMSSQDLDVIRLTAQYTAANGKDFLSSIAQREQRNPQFDFLKPSSALFNYFTTLVDQYTTILDKIKLAKTVLRQDLQKNSDRMRILEKAVHRWKWAKIEAEKQLSQSQQEPTNSAVSFVDWSKFSIVETITFDEVEIKVSDAVIQTVVTQDSGVGASMERPEELSDEDMDMDTDEEYDDAQEDAEEASIKVVENYKPTLLSRSSLRPSMVDPLSGRTVDADAVGEHIRVQLIDPRWRIEQQKFQDKQKETGYAAGDSISQNLQRFAKNRSDIFGTESESAHSLQKTSLGEANGPMAKRMKP